ncbi:MAG: isoprenylcysteine carboxylmethyltransferase family protein [Candidatus Marsarchaeota archaeon]|nr:isoprenylcysteine carboxylmethyltransferase family protein [Candidatus Marsarchaeota archaeon]
MPIDKHLTPLLTALVLLVNFGPAGWGVYDRLGENEAPIEGLGDRKHMTINLKLLVGQTVGLVVVFALALFLPAGTLAWPAGWVFLVLFFGFVAAINLWLLRHNPGLLQERMTGVGSPDQKTGDQVVFALAGVLFFAWLVVMPLDAVRFRWSLMPVWLQPIGAVIVLCSFVLFFLTFRENSYLSPAVRVQQDRGQTVVSTGPYRYVRHPMYAAFFGLVLGTPLLLGSWYGLLLVPVLVGIVARRALLEERTLRKELNGYEAYMQQVRFRLIPHVW